MEEFKHIENIHHFVEVQLVAGAKLALAWMRVHLPKLDLD
jgi:hypothetical protein